LPRLHNNVAMT